MLAIGQTCVAFCLYTPHSDPCLLLTVRQRSALIKSNGEQGLLTKGRVWEERSLRLKQHPHAYIATYVFMTFSANYVIDRCVSHTLAKISRPTCKAIQAGMRRDFCENHYVVCPAFG